MHKALASFRPPASILEVEGTAEQAGMMKVKRAKDAAVIHRHKLMKALASTRVPGEAALGKTPVDAAGARGVGGGRVSAHCRPQRSQRWGGVRTGCRCIRHRNLPDWGRGWGHCGP
jgi:hypothetical protein